MKLSDYLTRKRIIAELQTSDKQYVLAELVQPLLPDLPADSEEQLLKLLAEREELGSTAVGDGVALPHVKMAGLKSQLAVLGRSLTGIPFAAVDNQPVKLFFLLVGPQDQASLHLKTLAQISRMVRNSEIRQQLLTAADADDLYQIISDGDK